MSFHEVNHLNQLIHAQNWAAARVSGIALDVQRLGISGAIEVWWPVYGNVDVIGPIEAIAMNEVAMATAFQTTLDIEHHRIIVQMMRDEGVFS